MCFKERSVSLTSLLEHLVLLWEGVAVVTTGHKIKSGVKKKFLWLNREGTNRLNHSFAYFSWSHSFTRVVRVKEISCPPALWHTTYMQLHRLTKNLRTTLWFIDDTFLLTSFLQIDRTGNANCDVVWIGNGKQNQPPQKKK